MQEHSDVQGKLLIILDLRYKTLRGDEISSCRTYISKNKIAWAS